LHLWAALGRCDRANRPLQDAETSDVRVFFRALEEQLQTDTDPEEGAAIADAEPDHLIEPRVAKRPGTCAEGTDAGQYDPDASKAPSGLSTKRASAPTCCRAFSAERRFPMP